MGVLGICIICTLWELGSVCDGACEWAVVVVAAAFAATVSAAGITIAAAAVAVFSCTM